MATDGGIRSSDHPPPRGIRFRVFDPESSGTGFQELRFRVEVAGVLFGIEEVFTDLSSALLFFDTALFEVGSLVGDGGATPALRVVLDVAVAEGDSFGMGLAFSALPEPGTGLLLWLGLGWVLARAAAPVRRPHPRRAEHASDAP